MFELIERHEYSTYSDSDNIVQGVKIDGKTYKIAEDRITEEKFRKHTLVDETRYEDILKSLESKIHVLRYIDDDSFETLKNEIFIDLAKIMYKVDKKNKW